MIELLIKITGDNIEQMLDELTGIEIKTSNESLVKWCEEQRELLANCPVGPVLRQGVPHGTEREEIQDSKDQEGSDENNGGDE